MLSENHKINIIGPTELKLWPFNINFNAVAPHTPHTRQLFKSLRHFIKFPFQEAGKDDPRCKLVYNNCLMHIIMYAKHEMLNKQINDC